MLYRNIKNHLRLICNHYKCNATKYNSGFDSRAFCFDIRLRWRNASLWQKLQTNLKSIIIINSYICIKYVLFEWLTSPTYLLRCDTTASNAAESCVTHGGRLSNAARDRGADILLRPVAPNKAFMARASPQWCQSVELGT